MEITVPKFSNAHKLREAVKRYGNACEAFGASLYDPDQAESPISPKQKKKEKAFCELDQLIAEYVDNVVHQ